MINEQSLMALGLSIIAGMATIIGALIIFIPQSKSEKTITVALGFAAGIMLSVSFAELLPQGQALLGKSMGEKLGVVISILFLIVGIGIAMGIDQFVPHEEFDEKNGDKPHKNLFRVGFVSMLAITLHNFPEGIATFMAGYNDIGLGITITIAIALHNIPEGISVAMPIYFATGSKKKAFKYTFLSGIAEPLGALLAFLVLRPFINDFVLGAIFAAISGIMIYISLEELIPSSRQYGYNRLALMSTLAGICIMPISMVI
ncbi:zinc transporter ZupT [Clostridium paraputrificum]|uniref:zinc transporter ZupT n=1 Tax=Clostridium TaxID=1485 RepID=UPI003D3315B8